MLSFYFKECYNICVWGDTMNKVVLVTGSSRGIGRATIIEFASLSVIQNLILSVFLSIISSFLFGVSGSVSLTSAIAVCAPNRDAC